MRKGREDEEGEGEGENIVRRKEGGKRGAGIINAILVSLACKNPIPPSLLYLESYGLIWLCCKQEILPLAVWRFHPLLIG